MAGARTVSGWLACAGLAMGVAPGAASAEPPVFEDGTTLQEFRYTGGPQSWTVPTGVASATFDLFGARGNQPFRSGDADGLGARVRSTIRVVPGETLMIQVGGGARSGYNGGGRSGYGSWGGGATDVRRGQALTDRLLVAGGGGSSGFGLGDRGFDGLKGGGNAGRVSESGETAPDAGDGGGSGKAGGGATATSGGIGGAGGSAAASPFGAFPPGIAGASGALGQGGAGADDGDGPDGGGGDGGGGGGGFYGGGGGGSGAGGYQGGGDGGGGGAGSSLAARPEDVTVATDAPDLENGLARVIYGVAVDARVRLTRRPARALRRGERVRVTATVSARSGLAIDPVVRITSLRGFKLRRGTVNLAERCHRACRIDGVFSRASPPVHVVYALTYVGRVSRPTFGVTVSPKGAESRPADNVAAMRGDKKAPTRRR